MTTFQGSVTTKRQKAVELFLAVGMVAGMTACAGTRTPEADVGNAPDG